VKFNQEAPGEFVSSCGNWCIQSSNSKFRAFKVFTQINLGPFDTFELAVAGIANYDPSTCSRDEDFDVDDRVQVPEPAGGDLHNHEFVGTIVGFREDYAQVEDMDGNVFDIEPFRLEKV
jgi:hypothetical protein